MRTGGTDVEYWDAYDTAGNRTGGLLIRGQRIPDGLCSLSCSVAVRHRDGRYLLTRRDFSKKQYPGGWECTACGSALAGEDGLACIRRELREETGLAVEEFREVETVTIPERHVIYREYFCETDADPDSVRLQPGETCEYCWVTKEELAQRMDAGEIIPVHHSALRKILREM